MNRPQKSAPLPGSEPRAGAEEPRDDLPPSETEPEGAAAPPSAAAAPPAGEAPPAAPEPPKPPPDPRDDIVARTRAKRAAEIEEAIKDPQVRMLDTFAGQEPADPASQPDANREPAAPAAAAPAQPAAGSGDPAARAAAGAPAGGDPGSIKISVYGEDVFVSEDDVRTAGIATLQKERAAEYRLQQAAAQESRVRTYHQELDAYRDQLKALEKDLRAGKLPAAKDVAAVAALPSSGAPSAVDDVKLAEGARKFTEAVYKGDPKETAEALKALLADVAQGRTATPPPVDVNAVAEAAAVIVDKRTETRTGEEKRTAVNTTFRTEFSTVVKHPEAFAVAQTKFNALLADPDNAGKPWEDLAREAGKAALGRYPELREAPPAPGKSNEPPAAPTRGAKPVDETLTQRRTLKSKTVVAPSSSSARAPAPQPQPVRSNKQYVADMRKARGLPAS